MKPVVGLSPLYDDKLGLWMRPSYLEALCDAGAIPLVLPFDPDPEDVAQMLSHCDGLLLAGGPDVSPHLYGEETMPECGLIQPNRDEMEYSLLARALEEDMPILGVCRGSQMLNVYLGGTLYQDLATQLPNIINHAMKPPFDMLCHKVRLCEGEPLRELLGDAELPVNSIHHQAIRDIAPELVPMAYSMDDIVEGVWMPSKRFVWAVQWHPEWMWSVDARQRAIITHFVDRCRG